MKRLLSIAAAIIGFGATAASADGLPYRPASASASCAHFGGSYVGINGGWAFHDQTWVDRDNWIDNFAVDFNSSHVSKTRDGGTLGAQLGYNWQRRCTVLGIEVDANWAQLDGSENLRPLATPGTVLTLNDKVNWFGTARLRGGVVVDNLMLYVTGGLAYASIRHNFTVNDAVIPATESFSADRTRWGAVAGVGGEWVLSPNWSIKTEALYLKFTEAQTSGFSPAGAQTVNFDNQDSIWVVRAGLNFKFGGGGGPLK